MIVRLVGSLTVAALALASLSRPAAALSFNFVTIAGDILTPEQSAAFATAGRAWSSLFSDPVSVTVNIGFTNLAPGILGETSPAYITAPAAQVVSLLTADAKSALDRVAVTSFVARPPSGTVALTRAEALALGLPSSGSAGVIEFSTRYTFATSRSATGTIASNAFDLIGVAEHEIAHLLGFDSSIDGGAPGNTVTLLDEFRFNAAGIRTAAPGPAYFSVDDGTSAVLDPLGAPANFAPGGSGQYQASHWAPGVDGIMVPAYSPGQVINATPLDITALDILGYDTVAATAVPEPQAAALLAIGLLTLTLLRRREAEQS